jgi:hypothetical protein
MIYESLIFRRIFIGYFNDRYYYVQNEINYEEKRKKIEVEFEENLF